MKIFAYLRKSTDETQRGKQMHSLAYQKEEISRRFTGEYPDIEYTEVSESAAKKGRTEFSNLIKKIESSLKKEETILLAYDVDRLTRNLHDLAKLEELRENGLAIRTCDADYKGESATLMLGIKALFAKNFVGQLKSKMKSAYDQGAREGKSFAGVPRGYMAGPEKGVRIPHPKNAKSINKIFNKYISWNGSTSDFRSVANDIIRVDSDMSILSSHQGLHYLLRNTFYIGKISRNGKEYQGKHTPILSEELFNAVQMKLEGKSHRKIISHKFLYKRIITCECGSILTGEKQKGRVYYRCRNKECEFTTVREDRVTESLHLFLEKNELSPDKVNKRVYGPMREGSTETLHDIQYQRSSLTQQLNNQEKKLKDAVMEKTSGAIAERAYQLLEKDCIEIIESIEKQLNELNESGISSIVSTAKKICELLENKLVSQKNKKKYDSDKIGLLLKIFGANFQIKKRKKEYGLKITTYDLFKKIDYSKTNGNNNWLPHIEAIREYFQKEKNSQLSLV